MEYPLCLLSDLTDSKPVIVKQGDLDIALVLRDGEVYGYENECAHSGGPIGLGALFGRTRVLLDEKKAVVKEYVSDEELCLVCPWHGYEYDLKTGVCIADPDFRLRKLQVFKRGAEVCLQSDDVRCMRVK